MAWKRRGFGHAVSPRCTSLFILLECRATFLVTSNEVISANPPSAALSIANPGSGTKYPTAVTSAVAVTNAHAIGLVFVTKSVLVLNYLLSAQGMVNMNRYVAFAQYRKILA